MMGLDVRSQARTAARLCRGLPVLSMPAVTFVGKLNATEQLAGTSCHAVVSAAERYPAARLTGGAAG
jgi:hypothetical protein